MVQLMNSGNLRQPEPESAASCRDNIPVKLEIVEDSLEEEHGPLTKRSKVSPSLQQLISESDAFPVPPSQYNPLDEPSPLGLQLRKSPSLLNLIQMRLSQGSGSSVSAVQTVSSASLNSGIKKENKTNSAAAATEKLKASNFPASLLRIGRWEYKSRYEGDLVAKCYFAKHKLVWEVLEGGLKSKIEIQWSDIMALKANCPDNAPGTLTVVLARQPLFFRETNPQPRKHTLWQATTDFTDGQASTHRQHFLQCPQGLLNKHFEKLIQCDMRLNFLSRQPEKMLDSPYFEARPSIFEDPEESKTRAFGQIDLLREPTVSGSQNLILPTQAQSSSLESDRGDRASMVSEHRSQEAPSPSSVMDSRAIEGSGISEAVDSKAPRNWDQIKLPGLHPSMSMSDLMNHIGNCLSDNPSFSGNPSEYEVVLDDIAQYLLSDTQFTTASDEKSLMSKVNSLCCLLQKDPAAAPDSQAVGESHDGGFGDGTDLQLNNLSEPILDNKPRDDSSSKQPTGMSRKDSFGELLVHLPRIASLPKFLFNISEDGDTQAR